MDGMAILRTKWPGEGTIFGRLSVTVARRPDGGARQLMDEMAIFAHKVAGSDKIVVSKAEVRGAACLDFFPIKLTELPKYKRWQEFDREGIVHINCHVDEFDQGEGGRRAITPPEALSATN
ncbi:hypothetical protein NL676_038715 [Syzygium grande]|nr:hypothetical protein NL676_038715 [Syzygium grande]